MVNFDSIPARSAVNIPQHAFDYLGIHRYGAVSYTHLDVYKRQAYALESGSADMKEEEKRKVRIAAGGLQSVYRLKELLNPLRLSLIHI